MKKRKSWLLAAAVVSTVTAGAVVVPGVVADASTTVGSLDTTFGTGGSVLTDLTNTGLPEGQASTEVRQPNGDIVVAGAFGVARYLPTGKIDTSFGAGGLAPQLGGLASILGPGLALQSDGKIIVTGTQTDPADNGFSASELAVARYNANGTPDTSFGSGGITGTEIFTPPGGGTGAEGIAALVQPDGKVLVAGTADTPTAPRTFTTDGFAARFNSNGSVDTGFGTGGKTLITSDPEVSDIALDATGDIFVVARSVNVGFRNNARFVVQVTRYSAASAVLSTSPRFTFDGSAPTSPNAGSGASAVEVLPSGKALVLGNGSNATRSFMGFAEVNADGTLNAGFGTSGTMTAGPVIADFGTLLIQPDGKFVAGGGASIQTTRGGFPITGFAIVLARFNG
jgi:uncharacterized delta-60 repeat protein